MVRSEVSALTHESTGSTRKRQPVRTCIGCKERAPAVDLLRIVARSSDSAADSSECAVVPDVSHRLPGRGAWLHLDLKCVSNAERRRAFGRALRVAGVVDASEVVAFIEGMSPDRRRTEREEPGEQVTPVEKNRQQR